MTRLLRLATMIAALAVVMPWLSTAAEAHRLVLFVRVEDGALQGYGFFAGGGRPGEATLTIRNAAGVELFRGPAAPDGSFSFRPAVPADLNLVMDAGDGHVATAHVAARRLGSGTTLNAIDSAQAAQREQGAAKGDARAEKAETSLAVSSQDLAAMVDHSVDRAVSRQIAPLLEAYAQAESRVRFNEVVSGVAVIVGLAGLLLWGLSRRRTSEKPPSSQARP